MSTKPPLVVAAALVLPAAQLEAEPPAEAPVRTKGETKAVGAASTCSQPRHAVGRVPRSRPSNNPGYDILPLTHYRRHHPVSRSSPPRWTVDWVTHNEVITGKNAAPVPLSCSCASTLTGQRRMRVRYPPTLANVVYRAASRTKLAHAPRRRARVGQAKGRCLLMAVDLTITLPASATGGNDQGAVRAIGETVAPFRRLPALARERDSGQAAVPGCLHIRRAGQGGAVRLWSPGCRGILRQPESLVISLL